MENKYYTPTIEEFHVGFEYQFNHKDKGWIDFKFGGIDDWSILEIEKEIENNEIRVKYLDKEDIESLGYVCVSPNEGYPTIFFNKKDSEIALDLERDNLYLMIYKERYDWDSCLFRGTIKNKSELITLLKQLDI